MIFVQCAILPQILVLHLYVCSELKTLPKGKSECESECEHVSKRARSKMSTEWGVEWSDWQKGWKCEDKAVNHQSN